MEYVSAPLIQQKQPPFFTEALPSHKPQLIGGEMGFPPPFNAMNSLVQRVSLAPIHPHYEKFLAEKFLWIFIQ